MEYTRLPFYQYFSDQSLGSTGGTPRFEVQYKKVTYEHKFFFWKLQHDTYYCVMWDADRGVYQIYFKETSSKSQWLANFNFPEKYYDSFQYEEKDIQLKAASGWSELYCAIKWYIRNELSELMKEHGPAEVEIIGWSLGSATAQLCCQDLFFNYGIKAHVFTYGSVKPWFGKDSDMRAYLKQCYTECYNFKNREDVVGYLVPLPRYFTINPVVLKATSTKWWIFKLFKPHTYHTNYYEPGLYETIE